MANSVDPDQTAPIGAVCSGSTLFASILNSLVMIGKYLQQTTSADDFFRCIFFLALLRVKVEDYIHARQRENLLMLFPLPTTIVVCSLFCLGTLVFCLI